MFKENIREVARKVRNDSNLARSFGEYEFEQGRVVNGSLVKLSRALDIGALAALLVAYKAVEIIEPNNKSKV